MEPLEVLLRRTKRTHWWSPPLVFVSVIMTMVCLLFMFLFVDGVLGRLLDWGKTAEDRMGYAFGVGAAFEAIPIMLFGFACSVLGWRYGDNRRISVLLITAICMFVVVLWSGVLTSEPTIEFTEKGAVFLPLPTLHMAGMITPASDRET